MAAARIDKQDVIDLDTAIDMYIENYNEYKECEELSLKFIDILYQHRHLIRYLHSRQIKNLHYFIHNLSVTTPLKGYTNDENLLSQINAIRYAVDNA